jgi:hypothetical protein
MKPLGGRLYVATEASYKDRRISKSEKVLVVQIARD